MHSLNTPSSIRRLHRHVEILGIIAVALLCGAFAWSQGARPQDGDFFLNSWLPARLLRDGTFSYRPADALVAGHFTAQGYPGATRQVGRAAGYHLIYPPWIYALELPLGMLPYHAALAVWGALCGAIVAVGARAGAKWGIAVLLALIFRPLYVHLYFGQHAQIVLAALLAAWWALRRADGRTPRWPGLAAGAALAIGTVKPQLIALPLATAGLLWLAQRRWSALVGLIGGGAALYGLPLLLAPRALADWLSIAVLGPEQQATLLMDVAPSIWGVGRFLGWPDAVSALLALAIVAAFAGYGWRIRRRYGPAADADLLALSVVVGLLATPYLLGYDLIVLLLPAWRLLDHLFDAARRGRRIRFAAGAAGLVLWSGALPLAALYLQLALRREMPQIAVTLGLLALWIACVRPDEAALGARAAGRAIPAARDRRVKAGAPLQSVNP